ncbi:hypothetical protein MCUN1_003166 [Malassezia cuniculi]|uniref:GH16 domain-containing protein n=1 Tax=Malassezia cuniculi TaxID=948313 RepID=A0AAF0ESM3_9BASI|nr:hypothetical protein MCUN1_003166 [Malassezia cuniculi]
MDVRHARANAAALRSELRSARSCEAAREALRKIISAMDSDTSTLFPDILTLVTDDSEAKKLAYLYVVNHARAHPEAVPQCVSMLEGDFSSPNPIIRALAIRSLSNIHATAAARALANALTTALRENDAYVRRTGALCVAKLYTFEPSRAAQLVPLLQELLFDSSHAVVTNALVSLVEISERGSTNPLTMSNEVALHLVSILDQCTEWGQTYILDALVFYTPQTSAAAEQLAERVCARLQHANSAVVLSAVKAVVYLLNYIASAAFREMLCRRISEPLIMLLGARPEVQYVALRNILAIVQRRPLVLYNNVGAFFWRPSDPTYVRTAKLEIICRLAREEDAAVLDELDAYGKYEATKRHVIRAVGQLALRLDGAVERCVDILLGHLDTPEGAQEAVVCLCDVLRRYPGYSIIVPKICTAAPVLTEMSARIALVWVLGHYAKKIDGAVELLATQARNIQGAPLELQLALLTASTKLFLTRPTSGGHLATEIIKWAADAAHPDLRDRAVMYHRLLSSGTEVAHRVIMADMPPIHPEERMDRHTLDQILLHGGIGAVYHRLPHLIIRDVKPRFMPDSPALESGARPRAGVHLYGPLAQNAHDGHVRRTKSPELKQGNTLRVPTSGNDDIFGSSGTTWGNLFRPQQSTNVSRRDQRRSSVPAPLRGALVGLDPMQSEPDDYLHNPDRHVNKQSHAPTWRGIINIATLIIIALALIMLFAGYPIIANVKHLYGKSLSPEALLASTSPSLPHRDLIDSDTPASAKTSPSGLKMNDYKLVFSDEFNQPGRTFWPGDDPYFEALDAWYSGTHDYEWYTPEAINTSTINGEGYLTITLEAVPEHQLNFRSGMLVSWNKLCFQGGYLEAEVIFPGGPATQGYWPAIWIMGNLGRPGHLATTDGFWPYVYDGCDVGVLPNQTYINGTGPAAAKRAKQISGSYSALSNLPGMRSPSCTCPGEDHPGPNVNVARGVPEIDMFETQVTPEEGASFASQSYQAAPFDKDYNWNRNKSSYTIYDSSLSSVNTYKGGPLQEAMSVITRIPDSAFFDTDKKPCKFGIEYIPDTPGKVGSGSVTFYVDGKPSWYINGGALMPDNDAEIGWRKFSREPMFMTLNLGISSGFQTVNFGSGGVEFPAQMAVNYIRLYQRGDEQLTCDPPDYPTADYINRHADIYNNPNITQYNKPWPKNKLTGCS